MTTYAADASATLAAARDEYYRLNGFGADGGDSQDWVDFKLGPIPMPFPNTAARKRAVHFHDLHHTLTGYGTDLVGEFEISAWEVASGCADHYVAWQLNLAGMMGGLFVAPRRTWRAWRRGRQSRNLYRAAYDEALLGRRIGDVRRELGLDAPPTAPLRAVDLAGFVVASLVGFVLGAVMFALMIPAAAVANLAALFRRQ